MEELRRAARSAPAAALHPCVVPTVACFFAVAVRVRVRRAPRGYRAAGVLYRDYALWLPKRCKRQDDQVAQRLEYSCADLAAGDSLLQLAFG